MEYKKGYEIIIPVIISAILAIVVGFVFTTAVVTGLIPLLYTNLAIATFFLVTLIVISLLRSRREDYCVCEYGPGLLFGTLGAIIFSTLTIALTVGPIAIAVLVGIITFFITLAIIEFFLFTLCIIKSNCRCRE